MLPATLNEAPWFFIRCLESVKSGEVHRINFCKDNNDSTSGEISAGPVPLFILHGDLGSRCLGCSWMVTHSLSP